VLSCARRRRFGRSIGYVNSHVLTAARISANILLWTFDGRQDAAADELELA
jgi:hypothetical protein